MPVSRCKRGSGLTREQTEALNAEDSLAAAILNQHIGETRWGFFVSFGQIGVNTHSQPERLSMAASIKSWLRIWPPNGG